MKVDSPIELKRAFAQWRRKKRHVREPVPEGLRDRARRSMEVYGAKAVVQATRVERSRLLQRKTVQGVARKGRAKRPGAVPSFSLLELEAPSTAVRPIVEIETPAGLKVRVFSETAGSLGLLSSLCGMGAER